MDISKIHSFALLEEKIKYDSARQQVLSENFANVDTPGYKRKELEKPNFDTMLNKELTMVEPSRTNPNHIGALEDNSLSGWQVHSGKEKVQLDMEALEMMKNTGSFAQGTATYKKMLSLLKEVVNDGGN